VWKMEEPIKKSWEWSCREFEYEGVCLYKDSLLWYKETYPAYAGGTARKQSLKDFMENGPAVDTIPREILNEIYDYLNIPRARRKMQE